MYPFITLPVHVHTVIQINRLDLPVNISTALRVHRYDCSSVYLFSLFLHFRHNMHSYLSTHLLGYVHRDPHASPLPKNKYLPVTTTTLYLPLNGPDHDTACSLSCFKYSIWLTAKIYSSTFLLLYLSTDVSVHEYTCSVFLPFGHNIQLNFRSQIQPEINLPVYLHNSPLSNNKDLPVTINTCVPAHRCTLSWPYLSFSYFISD